MSLCAQSVSPHLRVLRLVGVCRLRGGAGASAGAVSLLRALHRGYHVLTLLAISMYVLQQFIYAYQVKNDLDKLSQVMFVMLCHVTCVAKQVVFHLDADKIDTLVASLDEPLMNQEAGVGGELLRDTASGAARLLRVYSGCAVATCVLWIVFPVLDRFQGRYFEFPFWTGFNYDNVFVFSAVVVYSFYTTNLVAMGNTTMDAFMATILDQCKTQLQILRVNFETLPERAAAATVGEDPAHYTVALHQLLVDCLQHYKKIIQLCTLLHEIFSVPLLVQFGVGGWILCMAGYNIVSVSVVCTLGSLCTLLHEIFSVLLLVQFGVRGWILWMAGYHLEIMNVLSIEFASTTLFILCILIELLLFCYYGNEVTVQSERVSESIYSMEWARAPLCFQRSLLVVMERAKRPLRPAAGLVIPLSLETYVTILKSSYSFYAVLRQTKEAKI